MSVCVYVGMAERDPLVRLTLGRLDFVDTFRCGYL